MRKRFGTYKKTICFLLALLCTAFMLSGCMDAPATNNGILTVTFLDVGQGDSALLYLPDGQSMLIDAGGNEAAQSVVQALKAQGLSRLDYVVVTHPHADHIGGMDKVIDAFDIGGFYMPRIPETQLPTTRTFEDMLTALEQKHLSLKEAKAGTVIYEQEDLKIEVLSPTKDTYDDLNHYSAVVKVMYGDTAFLFMGDAEKGNEKDLLNAGADVYADVIKIGHHGSKNATTEAFLRAVSPDYAVISCGKDNRYGHPAERILSLLQKEGTDVYRTDENSTVVAYSDGREVSITAKGGY